MKTFFTSLLLLFSVYVFAQPQKGDLYVGFSNLQINRNSQTVAGFTSFSQSLLFFSPNVGKFVTDNTLISGGFSFSNSFFSPLISESGRNRFGLNFLGAQYFGKGKLKGLAQVFFNSNLTSNETLNINRSLTGTLGLGGAYFVNDFTSVQLLYDINMFEAQEGQPTEYFSSDLSPNINLGLRTFILRNRAGIENLAAINSIRKSATLIGLSASFRDSGFSRNHSINGQFDYFFLDGLHAGFSLENFSISNKSPSEFVFGNFNTSLNVGYYIGITEKLSTHIFTEVRSQSQTNNIFVANDDRIALKQNAIRWNTELGVAIFLGRHKLEPGLGLRLSNTRFKELSLERSSDISPDIHFRYEWFLAQNFAFTANANYRINDIFYFVNFNPFFTDPDDLDLFEFSQNRLSLGCGFKWYLSTPVD